MHEQNSCAARINRNETSTDDDCLTGNLQHYYRVPGTRSRKMHRKLLQQAQCSKYFLESFFLLRFNARSLFLRDFMPFFTLELVNGMELQAISVICVCV